MISRLCHQNSVRHLTNFRSIFVFVLQNKASDEEEEGKGSGKKIV